MEGRQVIQLHLCLLPSGRLGWKASAARRLNQKKNDYYILGSDHPAKMMRSRVSDRDMAIVTSPKLLINKFVKEREKSKGR
jgi:hypothetical protein